MEKRLEALRRVTSTLEQHGIIYTLGGSGLLYALNLVSTVNDFDLTTDAKKEDILRALEPLGVKEKELGGFPFASSYLLSLSIEGEEVEVIGDFAIHSEEGVCPIPSSVSTTWNGIQLARPEAWYVAYTLMNRTAKAALIKQHVTLVGINEDMKTYFADKPVGSVIRDTLRSWR